MSNIIPISNVSLERSRKIFAIPVHTILQRLETISSTLLQCIQRTLDGGIIFRVSRRAEVSKKKKNENVNLAWRRTRQISNSGMWRGKTRRLPLSLSLSLTVFLYLQRSEKNRAHTPRWTQGMKVVGPSHLLSYLARLSTASEGVTGCWNPQNGGWMGPPDSSTGI